MKRKHNIKLTPRARDLRKEMTEQERKLWYIFLRKYPVRFLRQKVIENFIVDFYCAKAKIVIEIDGTQHFEGNSIAYDKERTAVLNGFNLRVIRFTNREINENFDDVCEKIHLEVEESLRLALLGTSLCQGR